MNALLLDNSRQKPKQMIFDKANLYDAHRYDQAAQKLDD